MGSGLYSEHPQPVLASIPVVRDPKPVLAPAPRLCSQWSHALVTQGGYYKDDSHDGVVYLDD